MANAADSKVYSLITERIVAQLRAGTVPWHKPWASASSMPTNAKTGKAYRGINVFVLGSAGFSDPRFLTFQQALSMGGCVRKGEKGLPVTFWKRLHVATSAAERAAGASDRKIIPLLRYYTVFNVSQCDGLDLPAIDRPAFEPIAEAEKIAAGYANGPSVAHSGAQAFYSPIADRVTMPARESFESPAHYYATIFHELGHSTGHRSRLARPGIVKSDGFGSHLYSVEELVAEMTAAMLCGMSGIDGSAVMNNSAAYIANWLGVIRGDEKMVIRAAGQAQRAADRILGVTFAAEDAGEADGQKVA